MSLEHVAELTRRAAAGGDILQALQNDPQQIQNPLQLSDAHLRALMSAGSFTTARPAFSTSAPEPPLAPNLSAFNAAAFDIGTLFPPEGQGQFPTPAELPPMPSPSAAPGVSPRPTPAGPQPSAPVSAPVITAPLISTPRKAPTPAPSSTSRAPISVPAAPGTPGSTPGATPAASGPPDSSVRRHTHGGVQYMPQPVPQTLCCQASLLAMVAIVAEVSTITQTALTAITAIAAGV